MAGHVKAGNLSPLFPSPTFCGLIPTQFLLTMMSRTCSQAKYHVKLLKWCVLLAPSASVIYLSCLTHSLSDLLSFDSLLQQFQSFLDSLLRPISWMSHQHLLVRVDFSTPCIKLYCRSLSLSSEALCCHSKHTFLLAEETMSAWRTEAEVARQTAWMPTGSPGFWC